MIALTINGQAYTVDADSAKPLLWVLRDELRLKGTKYGCGVGFCGICTVLIDGEPQHACRVPLGQLAGRAVTTVEGLAEAKHAVVQAWIDEQVPQCGYCQAGQLIAAAALLRRQPQPIDRAIAAALSGILCRCGTYQRIRRAIHRAAESLRGPLGKGQPRTASAPLSTFVLAPPGPPLVTERADGFALNAWVRIMQDDTVTVIVDRAEMGQGIATAAVLLVAEELEVEPSQVRIAFAPADPVYNNPIFDEQVTGGSTSVRGEWVRLRRAGARARLMLIAAAAARWGVSRTACYAKAGAVIHQPSGRQLRYGELAAEAAKQRAPKHVKLRPPAQWRLLGKSIPRLDLPDMVAGRAIYGIDIEPPKRLVATVVRPPVFGGWVVDYDAARARTVPGVHQVLAIDNGVAVVADDFWSALRGREALTVQFAAGVHGQLTGAEIDHQLRRAIRTHGQLRHRKGRLKQALARAGRVIEACYQTPYLAHVPLEPMNCTVEVRADGCDLWVGTQGPGEVWATAAKLTGLPKEKVRVHTLLLGGGFGRRLETDFVVEAVQIAKAVARPVQLLWTRQDDLQHDRYRPAHGAWLQGGLNAAGEPIAWFQRIAGPTLALNGIDMPYAIPHFREEQVRIESVVPTGPWRSVGASQNAFVIECFIDELAHAAGKDPLTFRLALLARSPRHRAVLERAAERAGWGSPRPAGRHQGLAVYRSFGSWVAEVAEVSITQAKQIAVHRVVCVIDCGITIHPDTVRAQLEGAVAFGLSATLKEAIRIEGGAVQQSSFADYPILTLAEMPQVEVDIVSSEHPPGGVGEPGVPPVAPAIANAVFAATGQRLRTLPLVLE